MRITPFGLILVLLTVILNTFSYGQTSSPDTLKIKPSECPGLPAEIADWLEQRSNIIPQTCYTMSGIHLKPENVLSGEFYKSGQTDWAVLTVDGDSMWVWVFPAGKADNPELLLCEKEKPFAGSAWFSEPHIGPEKGYVYYIEKVDSHVLIKNWEDGFGMPAKTPLINHQGINLRKYDLAGGWQFYHYCGTWIFIPHFVD
jgi:hypothetical protein